MTREKLVNIIRDRNSFLCVGLDSDLNRIPEQFKGLDNPILEFNKKIIDLTRDYCVAYKPNLAFYECLGVEGWQTLQETINYIGEEHFIIADAKRGDIGNTSTYYAEAFFKQLQCDAVTIAPYMGKDSVEPFLKFPGKWGIVLALTSNEGAIHFQMQSMEFTQDKLYEKVLRQVSEWGNTDNLMFVVGATRPEMFSKIREIVPDHFLLVPGVGAQGGSLQEVCKYGLNRECGLLVNSSRAIIYPDTTNSGFEDAVLEAVREIQAEMKLILQENPI